MNVHTRSVGGSLTSLTQRADLFTPKTLPFHHTSPNAPDVRDVVGTTVLAIIG